MFDNYNRIYYNYQTKTDTIANYQTHYRRRSMKAKIDEALKQNGG